MWRAGVHRRLVALVAAYGLALQGVLAAVAVASPALALDAVVCSAHAPGGQADRNPGGNPPPHGPDCALCPFACGNAAVAPPARTATLAAILGPGEAMPAPRPNIPVARTVLPAGLARAPPA